MLPQLWNAPKRLAQLDRLGWTDGLAVTCHGARIGIRVNDSALLERIDQYLPPGSRSAASAMVDTLYSMVVAGTDETAPLRRSYRLYVGNACLARTMEAGQLFDALESDVHFRVGTTARRYLFVHAGVVSWLGRAIVIPGRSMSGKTALVEALVRAGATYYSDEFAVLDARGRVRPYAKPLYVRDPSGGPRRKLTVEALGGRAGTKSIPVGLVVVTGYRQGEHWLPRVLSPGESVLALLSHTLLARVRPELALKALRQVVCAGAVVLEGKRGEAEEVTQAILSRVAATPVAAIEGAPMQEVSISARRRQDVLSFGGTLYAAPGAT